MIYFFMCLFCVFLSCVKVNRYKEYIDENNLGISQETMLIWFQWMADEHDAGHNSMFTYFSAIKSVLLADYNIDDNSWPKCKKWLSQYSDGKETKTAPIFTGEQIQNFMLNAPEPKYRIHKMALSFGLHGRFRAEDYAHCYHAKSDKERMVIFKS